MRYRGIIFDLDGVLCSTDRYHYLAWKALADEFGVPFDESINDRLRGISRRASLDILLKNYSGTLNEAEKEAATEKKNRIYRALLQELSPADLSAEVLHTLHDLRERGLLLAVGSSSRNTKFILHRLGLGSFFDAVSDGMNITHAKPDPEVFLKAAEYLGLPPADCLVVEDAEAGLEAAFAAGMDCAVLGGAIPAGRATYDLDTFSDLLRCVK